MNEALFLDQLLALLYQNAFNPKSPIHFSIPVISDPEGVQKVLRSPELFHKNYLFLDSLSIGRLSANGNDWKLRASLTQPFLAKFEENINQKKIQEIYTRHLKKFLSDNSNHLFQALIDAAMETIFLVYKLPLNTPWPVETISQIRDLLTKQQALVWGYGSFEQFSANQVKLQALLTNIEIIWRANPDMALFLNSLSAKALSPDFNAVGELIQVFQAASETTASTLMWTIDCLLRYPSKRETLFKEGAQSSRDFFIKEVMRLFPPLPFVTRVSMQKSNFGNVFLNQGDVVLVSIIGLHSNPLHWQDPQLFNPERSEWTRGNLDKNCYLPFSTGPRACGGMRLANFELHAALEAILSLCEFAVFKEPLMMTYGVTSRPAAHLSSFLKLK